MSLEVSKFLEDIKVEGHVGSWHEISRMTDNGKVLHLMEHDEYGEDCGGLIINDQKKVVLDDVWNGWLDYFESQDK